MLLFKQNSWGSDCPLPPSSDGLAVVMLHTTATLHHETESELTDVLAPTYSTKGFPFLFNHVLDIGLTRSYAFPSVLDLGKI